VINTGKNAEGKDSYITAFSGLDVQASDA